MSWRFVVGLLGLLIGLASFAPTAPAPRAVRPRVEIVFCLDTTGSMTGLLDGLRRSYWSLANRILAARPKPELKLGVVAFRDKGEDYVTRVFDLRDDLDAVYLDIRDLSAAGGGDTPEHVNQALHDAVHKISWSSDKETLKIVFLVGDAAAHIDYTDDVKYPLTCQIAKQKGILLHAIQCGSDTDCAAHFADIARRGGGAHVSIPQNGGVETTETPLDRRLADLHTRLVKATLPFGSVDDRFHALTMLEAAEALSPSAAADRAGVLAQTGRVAKFDLLDASRAGRVIIDQLPETLLPGDLGRLRVDKFREHLDTLQRSRAAMILEAHELDSKRSEYLRRPRELQREAFDAVVMQLLRRSAARRLRF